MLVTDISTVSNMSTTVWLFLIAQQHDRLNVDFSVRWSQGWGIRRELGQWLGMRVELISGMLKSRCSLSQILLWIQACLILTPPQWSKTTILLTVRTPALYYIFGKYVPFTFLNVSYYNSTVNGMTKLVSLRYYCSRVLQLYTVDLDLNMRGVQHMANVKSQLGNPSKKKRSGNTLAW